MMENFTNIPSTYKRSEISLKSLINKVCAERGHYRKNSDTYQFYTDIAIELMKLEQLKADKEG